jgi:hypothetical protein
MIFNIQDYLRMYKKWGIKLPFLYFMNCHLYDLIHKTDTHIRLKKSQYTEKIKNLDDATLYQASWSSEIKRSFTFLNASLGDEKFINYSFIDIGSGKGKVILVWVKLLKDRSLLQNVVGIEFSKDLVRTAKKNYLKVHGRGGAFICIDALDVDYDAFGENLIFYLYNPFNECILENFLRKINKKNVYIISNGPTYFDLIISHGYKIIKYWEGFHPNTNTVIFKKIKGTY